MTIFFHEFRSFVKSGSAAIVFVFVLVFFWGAMLGMYPLAETETMTLIWFLSFSLVTSAGIASTVFVRERLAGTLEVLLVSGVSRKEILFGKLGFSLVAMYIIGLATLTVASSVASYFVLPVSLSCLTDMFITFAGGGLLISSSSAWLALSLRNPRMTHVINFFVLATAAIAMYVAMESYGLTVLQFFPMFILMTIPFLWLSLKQLHRQSVVQVPLY